MNKQMQPLLSIGIIFKNEIRCLERCLTALTPLREVVSCELVMADTGSDDGSRKIAEKYADILFDFPWIDDFSAARNAVMDRCSGKWYLSIDADEWLDENITQLVNFLNSDIPNKTCAGAIIIRNYNTYNTISEYYRDFMAVRLYRMSEGLRYQGAIHESVSFIGFDLHCENLPLTILHHDGYAGLNTEQGREKRERNLSTLRNELEKDPDNLRALMHYLESGKLEDDYMDRIHHAIKIIQEKKSYWEMYGPPILRYAVFAADDNKLSEFEEWVLLAESLFPESSFTRIDVEYAAFGHSWNNNNYDDCILRGERYLKAIADLREGRGDQIGQFYSTLAMSAPRWELNLRIFLADSYIKNNQADKILTLLEDIDYKTLDVGQTENCIKVFLELQRETEYDISALILRFYEQICLPEPSKEIAEQRRRILILTSAEFFDNDYRENEKREIKFVRHAYTLFLPLSEKFELGTAAAILESKNKSEIENLLNTIEKWSELPISAIQYVIDLGIEFPLPSKPLNLEDMDNLANRLTQDQEAAFSIINNISLNDDLSENIQRLSWIRGLNMAIVWSYNWLDKEYGMYLARSFANIERQFIPACYASKILTENNIYILPPIHRFGWYLAKAFDALDSNDTLGYVRLLKSALATCNEMQQMIKFLIDNTDELHKTPEPSAEMLELSKQIRAILNLYPPDDPTVKALKDSPAYKKVAHLIEKEDAKAPTVVRLPKWW